MADEPIEPTTLPAVPQSTPVPLWQAGPPGPAGAAVDPPLCSPSGAPFQAMSEPAPLAEPAPAEWPAFATPEAFGLLDKVTPDRLIYGPFTGGTTDDPPHLGKPTSPAELRRIGEKLRGKT